MNESRCGLDFGLKQGPKLISGIDQAQLQTKPVQLIKWSVTSLNKADIGLSSYYPYSDTDKSVMKALSTRSSSDTMGHQANYLRWPKKGKKAKKEEGGGSGGQKHCP